METVAERRPPIDDAPGGDERPTRIGAVSYLNTLPLIGGLEKLAGVELRLEPPARLMDLLVSGAIDLGLVSVVDFQRSPVPLVLVPAGMIGCDGPTLTVRLFSRVPLDRLRVVHVDRESHTSVALMRVLLAERFGVAPEVVEFDAEAGRSWPEAALLIGDKVVRGVPGEDAHPHQLDLGEAWKELTGLPFVYAAWMCRADRAEDRAVRTGAAVLDRQRRHNGTRLDWIVAQHGAAHGWSREAARTYLAGLLRFEVGDRESEAVERFFDLSARHGLIGSRRPTVWMR